MWDLVVEWWPFWSIPVWVSAGFLLCAVMANGRIEDAFMEAEARADHARFVREEAVRDGAEVSEDYDLEVN